MAQTPVGDRNAMSFPELLSWAWRETPPVHKNSTNLLIHIVAVPLFVLGHILLVAGVLFSDPGLVPYAITAACIGAAAGGAAALGAFKSLPAAILAGLFTGVLAALVSAPITAYVAQATSSPGQVALRGVFDSTCENLLKVVTLEGFLADPLDKALSFALVFVLLRALPREIVEPFLASYWP